VRAYVSNLRRVLEPDRAPRTPPALLRTSGSGYGLDVPDGSVDALAFAADAGEAVRADQDGDWAGALAAADDALGRWPGSCWRAWRWPAAGGERWPVRPAGRGSPGPIRRRSWPR
jgi:hypothetical protein